MYIRRVNLRNITNDCIQSCIQVYSRLVAVVQYILGPINNTNTRTCVSTDICLTFRSPALVRYDSLLNIAIVVYSCSNHVSKTVVLAPETRKTHTHVFVHWLQKSNSFSL